MSSLLPAGTALEEISHLAIFLASTEADYVNGGTYIMKGGLESGRLEARMPG
jgi:NAD(P)-dependent dehydrogenase (short-subunit alcohol dehydrogenase family)